MRRRVAERGAPDGGTGVRKGGPAAAAAGSVGEDGDTGEAREPERKGKLQEADRGATRGLKRARMVHFSLGSSAEQLVAFVLLKDPCFDMPSERARTGVMTPNGVTHLHRRFRPTVAILRRRHHSCERQSVEREPEANPQSPARVPVSTDGRLNTQAAPLPGSSQHRAYASRGGAHRAGILGLGLARRVERERGRPWQELELKQWADAARRCGTRLGGDQSQLIDQVGRRAPAELWARRWESRASRKPA